MSGVVSDIITLSIAMVVGEVVGDEVMRRTGKLPLSLLAGVGVMVAIVVAW